MAVRPARSDGEKQMQIRCEIEMAGELEMIREAKVLKISFAQFTSLLIVIIIINGLCSCAHRRLPAAAGVDARVAAGNR